MKRIKGLITKIRKSLHGVLDLDSYRALCLELSMLENLIEQQKRICHRQGVLDCKKIIEDRLDTLTA